jgi:EF hand
MFKSMDANGNGILEPSEIPEDRRRFLERFAGGVDLSQPVPIAKLQESMQAARDRMGRGGMGGGGMGGGGMGGGGMGGGGNRFGGNGGDRTRGGGADRGNGDPGGSDDKKPEDSKPAVTRPAPQVAGFGGQPAAIPVRGFGGAAGGTSSAATTSTASTTTAPAASAAPTASGGPDARIAAIVAGVMKNDKNGDGVLEKDQGEWEDLSSTSRKSDANGDGRITVDELNAAFGNYAAQRGSNAGSPATTAPASTTGGNTTSTGGRRSYRAKTPTERLPSDIPSWFRRSDENGDGQVGMAEYATSWTAAKVSEFSKYDLNGDGIITAKECMKVERK